MNKHIITICLLQLTTLLFSCSDDNDTITVEKQVANLNIKSSHTFRAGDAIGLYIEKRANGNTQSFVGNSNYQTNIKWVCKEDGNWEPATADDIIYTPTDGLPLDIYAYYPYIEQANTNEIVLSTTSPIMTGNALAITGTEVILYLNDKTSLLKVVVPDTDILSSTQSTLINVIAGGTIIPANLGTDNDFVISTTKSNQQLSFENGYFMAYLPEQDFEKETLLIDIKNDNDIIHYTIPEEFSIRKNKENRIIINYPVENPADLPNTFMLQPGSELSISVQKAYTMWQTNELLSAISPELSEEVNAVIIWEEDMLEVIESLEVIGTGENAIIYIKTLPEKTGNAVVAVKIGGTVRWSWQVWVSDYNPLTNQNGRTYDFNGLTFMDRNLGATVNPESGGERTFGFFYQWGRKDPFPMRGNLTTTAVTTEISTNLANSIIHPEVYITASSSPNDWYAKTANQGLDRWHSEEGRKTAFDPCPQGWRVPVMNMNGESPWAGLPLPEDENKWGNGWYFDELGYYPAGGQITAAGAVSYTGSAGFYHIGIAGSSMRIDFTSINLSFGGGRAAARSVRCVKE